jgi:transcriptional regulator with XRE-family HTH domain
MTLGLSAGVHPTYISGIERGLRNPTALNLVALAHALGVRPGELLPDDL